MTNIQQGRFNARLFASDMMGFLGARYVSILIDETKISYNGVIKWFKQEIAPKNGPSKKNQEIISNLILKRCEKKIAWSDYLLNDHEGLASTASCAESDPLVYGITNLDANNELTKANFIIEQLRKEANGLRIKLQEEEYKNIELRALLCKK